MELKQFISDALVDICEAVDSAREQVRKSSGVAIAPGSLDGQSNNDPSMVEFDVFVTVSESISKGGEGSAGLTAKISVVSAHVNAAGVVEKATESGRQQRIRFLVPVYFQAHMVRR